MVTTAIKPAGTTSTSTEALARAAISDLVAFWAGLPVDPIDRGRRARRAAGGRAGPAAAGRGGRGLS